MSKIFRDFLVLEAKFVKDASTGKLIVSGPFSKCDIRNANGRVYKRPLWERILRAPEIVQTLSDRTMLGELGHPDIVETTLTNVSHIVTKLQLQPNGDIYGEAEILDTPTGRILKTLYEAGVKMGISSRGYLPEGSTLVPEGSDLVVPEDYQLVGFDFVLMPSSPGAYPTIKESKKAELRAILAEGKSKLVPEAYALIDSLGQSLNENAPLKPSVAEPNKLICSFTNLSESRLTEISSSFKSRFKSIEIDSKPEYGVIEFSGNLNESEFKVIAARVNKLVPTGVPFSMKFMINGALVKFDESIFRKSNFKQMNDKEVSSVGDSNGSAYEVKLESVVDELKDRYLTAEEVITGLKDRCIVSEEVIDNLLSQNKTMIDVISDLKTRYLTAEDVISQFREYTASVEESLTDVVSLYKVAEGVIGDLTKRYTLSEDIIEDLRNRYLAAESTLGSMKNLYLNAEGVINDLKARYLTAESVIDDLTKRYTLSEGIIGELRDAMNEGSTKVAESQDASDSTTSINESGTPVLSDSDFVALKAEEYGLSIAETRRLFTKANSDRNALDLVLSEKAAALNNKYEEFPFGGNVDRTIVNEHDTVPAPEDKLTHIITRVM